ncbi:MAG: hypothetical protein IPJ46_06665 [Anaerolineales bacterium]|nr:hypothetical protein [Anaerolineales bacterium]
MLEGTILACAVTGAARFSYNSGVRSSNYSCKNNTGEEDFIIWLIVSHHPTTHWTVT